MQNINQLQSFMYEMSVAPDPAKQAFQVASGPYQSGSGNAVTQLKSFARNTPEPVTGWLNDLADQSWKVVLQTANGHVNAEWRTQVYEPYRQGLAGRYPINGSAGRELAVFDFTEFFKPEGTVDKFTKKYVKPFIDTRQGWSNRSIDGYSMGFSSSTLAQLRRANQIKEIFFSGGASAPSVSFQVKPHEMEKSDVRFLLEIGDERVTYSHGPKFWSELSWSGSDGASRVRIGFEDVRDQRHFESYEGPWGWFRLLDDSTIRGTRSSNVFLVTFEVVEEVKAPGGRTRKVPHTVTYRIKAKSVNNPFSKNLLGSFRLPETI
jgi:type VI secretion system protein ImpL